METHFAWQQALDHAGKPRNVNAPSQKAELESALCASHRKLLPFLHFHVSDARGSQSQLNGLPQAADMPKPKNLHDVDVQDPKILS
jgi:hypothetical protein